MNGSLAGSLLLMLTMAACSDAPPSEFYAVSLRVAGFVEASGIT